ncbi:MAG: hypothetical protein WCT27_03840 [Patescibacteria group bacterium]
MRELFRSITKKEWRLVLALAAVIVIVTAVPYLYGYFSAPAGKVYTGIHYLTPGDTNVMLSNIEQVKQGHDIFINPYTAEPQHRIYVNPFWLGVGWMAKIFQMSALLAYHVARSLLIFVFLFVVYLFLAYIFADSKRRVWAILVICTASGLGLFFNPFLFDVNRIYEHPTDTWVPESVSFLTLYHSPHLIASVTLIVLVFLLMLIAFDRNQYRYSISAGIAGLFLLWFHPFNGPTIFGVLMTYMLLVFLRDRKLYWGYVRHYCILAAFAIPPTVYMYYLSRTDWVIRKWNEQNLLPSPTVWMYLIGYGILVPLALYGLWITLKDTKNKGIFLISWLITSSALLYVPIYFQRRLSEGLHIPIAILATAGIIALYERWREPSPSSWQIKASVLVISLVIFLPLSNFQIMGQDIFNYQTEKTYPYYVDRTEIEAMYWLKDNTTLDDVVFSTYEIGNFIPAYSGRIVWLGHGPQTINLEEKFRTAQWFWREDGEDGEKYDLLKADRVTYVWYGEHEKLLGAYNPATKPYLKKIFSNADVTVYRVE